MLTWPDDTNPVQIRFPYGSLIIYIYNVYNLNIGIFSRNIGIFSRKRLRGRLQTFAGMVANVCRNVCNALRPRRAKLTPKSSVLLCIREKGKKGSLYGALVLPGNLLNRFDVGPCMIYDKCGK